MVKLSIVIPYYNTYELTKKLLLNLIIQCHSFESEIIVIDDGSDKEKQLDWYINYIKENFNIPCNNIKIIHQENRGVSVARNTGIEIAQGQYIAFIDSDDMIMVDYMDTLLHLIDERDEDIIYFNWMDINTNEIVRHPNNPSVWKAIYKKDILPRFEECYKSKEDYFFNQELDMCGYTKYYYDKVLYIYNSGREDGLTCKSQRGEL